MTDQKNEFTIRPNFSQYNFAESWLQDQARNGLILKNFDMGRYTFISGDANNRRYRIMPVGLLRRKKEIKKWEDCSWKNFPTGLGAQIFYTDDENLPEVYPTKNDFRKAMNFEIAKTIFWTVISTVAIVIISKSIIEEIFLSKVFNIGESIFLTMCYIPLVAFWIYGVLGGIQYVYTLLNDKPVNHDLPYQRNLKISKTVFYGLFVGLGLCLVGGILFCFV